MREKEDGGKKDNSFSAFWENEVVCTCSLEDNSKHVHTKLGNERGECEKKSLPLLRVTELRLKIKYLRRKPRHTYTQINSTLFSLAEKMRVVYKKLLDTRSIHSYTKMLQQEASQK